jgi:hypothetical protein
VATERICIDPGPGFGKTHSQTMELVRNFHEFARLGYPVMCAVSRKSFLGNAYHIEDPQARDAVSATEALMACELGATVVRTHNVAATVAHAVRSPTTASIMRATVVRSSCDSSMLVQVAAQPSTEIGVAYAPATSSPVAVKQP